MKQGHYGRLMAMVVLSFIAMYALMYAMVNSFDNVFNNVNQVYMAGLMAAPMLLIELALMASMRSEEHTSELQSLMRISYAVFCLKKKKNINCKRTPEKT